MKAKLLKTMIIVGLFTTGSLFADDNLKAFYPPEDTDNSANYVLDFDNLPATASNGEDMMEIKMRDEGADFSAFYPAEDNDDSATYVADFETLDFDNLPATASGGEDMMEIKLRKDGPDFSAFYPIEDDDSARY